MSEMKKLTCPSCGRELEIPADLAEFSCLYCGARAQTAHVVALNATAGKQYAELRARLRKELPQAVTPYPNLFKKVDKKHFASAFAEYEGKHGETVDLLEVCARLRAGDESACMQEIAADLLDELEAFMQADTRWKSKGRRSAMMFEVKSVLALFLTPMVRKRKISCGEEFRTELNRMWLERWPQERWSPGDHDVIMGGFKRHKLCFITTATCHHEGKPDNCAELTAFRAFRDGWLTEHGDAALIERYYAIAPSIVTCIDHCDDAEARYREVRERWLEPCYKALLEHREADCRETYIDMVQTLEQRYLQ